MVQQRHASMPATPAPAPKQKAGAPTSDPAQTSSGESNELVRLHITPFTPALLKVYLPPSLLPAAQNISYHAVETFPEKGFGYVELPAMEAQKLKKKLNGSTLKGSKVRIEVAKPEKRKKLEAERAEEQQEEQEERPVKRAKKDRKKKEGVLEGVELPDERKVKRGWTEVPVKGKKERKDKRDKEEKKKEKAQRKESKYTKEPEVLFKAKLTPVAATEVARKEKKDKKKDKAKQDKLARALDAHLQADAAASAGLDEEPVIEVDPEDIIKPTEELVPFALPLADDKTHKKIYKLIKKGRPFFLPLKLCFAFERQCVLTDLTSMKAPN